MKKLITGILVIIGLTVAANADNLNNINMNSLGYYFKNTNVCQKIDNQREFKQALLNKFGNVPLIINTNTISGMEVIENNSHVIYNIFATSQLCNTYRNELKKTLKKAKQKTQQPTISSIGLNLLKYKLHITYGGTCQKIDNPKVYKQKLLNKFGDIKLTSLHDNSATLISRSKTGNYFVYSFFNSLTACHNTQKGFNQKLKQEGKRPLFTEVE